MKFITLFFAAGLSLYASGALAEPLSIDLRPSAINPASPQMGDSLTYHTVIRNDGSKAVDGLIAWISLVQIDKGKEQPVDLEDWSAHKAIAKTSLNPGRVIETDWPIRLIKAGHYRVVVSAATRTGDYLKSSPFADFSVLQKPVVESQRVLPVAAGVPLLIAIFMLRLWLRSIQYRTAPSRNYQPTETHATPRNTA